MQTSKRMTPVYTPPFWGNAQRLLQYKDKWPWSGKGPGMKEIFVNKDALRQIWVEWKTVIITAAGVFLTISSLYWLPLILEQLPQYQGNPAEIQEMTEQISNIFWFIVFVMVSLQMTTAMRPLLTTPDKDRGWWTSEKQFFLAHFGSCFDSAKSYAKPAPERPR